MLGFGVEPRKLQESCPIPDPSQSGGRWTRGGGPCSSRVASAGFADNKEAGEGEKHSKILADLATR